MSEQAERCLRCGDHRVVHGRSYRRSGVPFGKTVALSVTFRYL
jgi:hypothetical protein